MKLIFRIVFFLYVALLLWFYLHPSMGITSIDLKGQSVRVDYPLHGLAFAFLPILSYLATKSRKKPYLWYALLAVSFILALSMEHLQQLTPGRTFNPLDILSNFIGVVVGLLLVLLYDFLHKKKADV